ncbi:MAG: rubrerythrin family protein [Nitrospiraceae bacterium]|nr:rubrerythrin family protein [Nitrospiraceae bacterium]
MAGTAATESKAVQDLMEAFAGESQAFRKYLLFAMKADAEGFKNAARLFRAAAEAEAIHSHNHLKALGAVKSTKENLGAAINGETFEFEKMYPRMIEDAKAEGNSQALRSFQYAIDSERGHAELFKQALAALEDKAEKQYYVCEVCGYTVEGEALDECPLCKAKKKAFKKID